MPNPRIAIVDDEEELRENLRDLLEFKGYEVVIFSTAEELLKRIDAESVDLLLLDNQLPGLNGLEVFPILREKKPDMPVALVTASSQRDTLDLARGMGINRIILKPYSQADVLKTIEELLREK